MGIAVAVPFDAAARNQYNAEITFRPVELMHTKEQVAELTEREPSVNLQRTLRHLAKKLPESAQAEHHSSTEFSRAFTNQWSKGTF